MVTWLNRRSAAVLTGIAASFLAGSVAYAQDDQIIVQAPSADVRGERIAYNDLNLATREGQQTLERRVSNAIERVCLHDEGRWYGLSVPDYISCSEKAWRGARPQMIGAVDRARRLAYRRK